MDADDLATIGLALIGLLLFVGAWWADREHQKVLREIDPRNSQKLPPTVTTIRRERRPPE